jgi:hypothetical protein
MLRQQLQAASTLGLLQMGQIICHIRVFSDIGQIRMKNDSRNVDVRANFKRRSIPEVPQRVLECDKKNIIY